MNPTTIRQLPPPDTQPPSKFIYHLPREAGEVPANMSTLRSHEDEELTMKDVLRTFLTERLSAHAFPRIFNSPNLFRQFIWTIVSLAFFGLMLWQVCVTLIRYYQYPKSTQVEISDNTALPFPAVTICNLNALKASKAMQTIWQSAVRLGDPQGGSRSKRQATTEGTQADTTPGTNRYSSSSSPGTSYSSYSYSYSPNNWYSYSSNYYGTPDSYTQAEFYNMSVDNFASIIEAMPTLDGSQMSDVFTPSISDIEHAGYQASEFIKSCSFDGEICSHEDFLVWQNGMYGNCFTFNSMFEVEEAKGRNRFTYVRKTTRYGAKYGLRLILDADEDEYIYAVTPNKGARVSVHHPDQIPFPEDNGFNVAGAFRTGVSVSQHLIKRVPAPHGECVTDEKWNTKWQGSYTAEACYSVCLEGRIRSRCHCASVINNILYNENITREFPRCNPTNQTQDVCVAQTRLEFLYNSLPCDCPPACREISYSYSISFDEPAREFDSIVEEIKNVSIAYKTLKLHIYYSNLNVQQVIEQPAFSFLTLISNIGGSFGLFVGLSLVTIVEMMEFIFDFTRAFCSCPKAMKRSKKNSIDAAKQM